MPIPGNMLSATTEMVDPNTSGWTTKQNCTIVKGVGGRNGDGCLAVRSVAAGEIQARTVSSYPVTAGTVYQTFADTAGAVPERIGIRWLNAANTEVAVTWSLATAGASSSWHRVGVAGAAPAGATQAQVLLSSTEVGASVAHYWENVYLGLPIRTTGNLFPFSTESAEVDASGWVAEVNASVSRQVPVVSWPVDNYLAGGHTIAITATGAGNASARGTDRPAVTPGVEYIAYAYLNPPTLAADTWVELRFYDSNGNQIAVTRASLAQPAPGTGWYRQRASAIAPANAATCGIATGINGASAGQVWRVENAVVGHAAPVVGGSVLTYTASSFEQDAGGWTVPTGVATLARSTPWGFQMYGGSYSLAIASATATSSTIRSPRFATPAAGSNYRTQVVAKVGSGSWTVTVRVRWYDAANVDLGASSGVTFPVPGGGWFALPTDAPVPAGATQGAIELVVTAGAPAATLFVDHAAMWEALPLTAVVVHANDAYIALTLRELVTGQSVTVYREGPDGTRTLVRGVGGLLDRTLVDSDLLVVEDYEAPLGVPLTYRIELYPAGATTATLRASETVAIPVGDINEVWLKDPGNPQRNLKVMVEKAPDWSRPVNQSVYRVQGRRNAVVLSGIRSGLEGELSIWTRSDDERAGLHWLLDSGNTLLWQAAPGLGVGDMYVTVGQVTEGRTAGTAREPWRTWSLPLTEADMPVTTGVAGSRGRTWQDILAEFATWDDLPAVYATWEAVLLDRRMG